MERSIVDTHRTEVTSGEEKRVGGKDLWTRTPGARPGLDGPGTAGLVTANVTLSPP